MGISWGTLSTLIATLLLARVPPLCCAEPETGVLIFEGKRMDPPFKVEIVGDKVLVNGRQFYPHIPNKAQVAEKGNLAEASAFLSSLHEGLIERQRSEGKEKALDWIKVELKNNPKYPNATVQDTRLGVMVNLTGIDDIKRMDEMTGFFDYMRADNTPSAYKLHSESQTRIASHYKENKRRYGKLMALALVNYKLMTTPGIAEYHLNWKNEAYDIRWKGEPNGSSIGLWPEGASESAVYEAMDNPQPWMMQSLRFQADEVKRPLSLGLCVVVVGGHVYRSFKDRQEACGAALRAFNDQPPQAETLAILEKYFSGSERWMLRDFQQYWQSRQR